MTADAARAALLEALPMPALLVDRHGVVQQANSSFSGWFGGREADAGETGGGEALGKPLGFLAEWLRTDDRLTPAAGSVATGGQAMRVVWEDLDPRAGEPLPGTVALTPVRGATDAVEAVLLLFPDLATCEQDDRASCGIRTSVAVGRVVGNAAHEINNSLSLVTGYTELRLATELDDATRRDLQNALQGGRRAARTAEHLCRFARRLRVRIGGMDVNELVSDCAALVSRTYERNGMLLIEDLSDDLPETSLHAANVQLVVLSLLIRSLLRLSDQAPGGVAKVTTAAAGTVTVTVEDDPAPGDGKATSMSQRDRDELRGGGLSLAACRQIARMHGGDLRLEAEGESSRITLSLPQESRVG